MAKKTPQPEINQWAYGLAAALLSSDIETAIDEDEPDRERKVAAMRKIIAQLRRRGEPR